MTLHNIILSADLFVFINSGKQCGNCRTIIELLCCINYMSWICNI